MSKGCCNECGYKADYIIDNNNYTDNGYKDLNQVPTDKMLCGVCYEEQDKWATITNGYTIIMMRDGNIIMMSCVRISKTLDR